jgi:hypothetical protein
MYYLYTSIKSKDLPSIRKQLKVSETYGSRRGVGRVE